MAPASQKPVRHAVNQSSIGARGIGPGRIEYENLHPLSGTDLQKKMQGVSGFRGVFDADRAPVLTRPGECAIANLLPSTAAPGSVGHWVAYGVAGAGPDRGHPVYFDPYGLLPAESAPYLGLPVRGPAALPVGAAVEDASKRLGKRAVYNRFGYQEFGHGKLSRDSCGDWAAFACRASLNLESPILRAMRKLSAPRRNAYVLAVDRVL